VTSAPDSEPRTADVLTDRVRLPRVAVVMAVPALILIGLGSINFWATEPRGYFQNAATQAAVGMGMVLAGALFLVGALVIIGVRAIAQQQLDLLRR
jgi:hypothetical protein